MILSGLEIRKQVEKGNIRIEPFEIYYHSIEGDIKPYSSEKYQNNNGIQPSLFYKDFEKK